MNMLFCCDPMNKKKVDPEWEHEYNMAQKNNMDILLFDYDNHINKGSLQSFSIHPPPENLEPVVYRGWMMPTASYKQLYNTLLSLNFQLINSPEEYQHCYYLPDSYNIIEACTPPSVFHDETNMPSDEALIELLSVFGDKPIIVKDFVKSQKHYWNEACFIPNASDLTQVKKVVSTFIKKQGDAFQGGLVFREFIKLEPIGLHPKSNMPLTQEYRIFVLNNTPIALTEYWEDGHYGDIDGFDLEEFRHIFTSVKSNFFTVDIAKNTQGDWIVIELGDGQVAEYLGDIGLDTFYESLKDTRL